VPHAPDRAIATLHGTEGSGVAGTVRFVQEGPGVRVSVRLEGLAPGNHRFHIHEYGECSSPDGMSAGGHFDPFGAPHAAPHDRRRHVGDLGNVTANDAGVVAADFLDAIIGLHGVTSILGRGVIVHAGADDLETPPAGAAGARVACGVVGIAGGAE
jgi:Cu-Zn family superoxide dismutase